VTDTSPLSVGLQDTLIDAMRRLDETAKGIVLLLSDDGRLVATVTDGDLRRAVLAGTPLNSTLEAWQARWNPDGKPPLTLPPNASLRDIRDLMLEHNIRHVPLVDPSGRVRDLILERDLLDLEERQSQALVMAGGEGKRLWPLTKDTPKPLLDVGDSPVIERIVGQIKEAGIGRIAVSTHYRAEMIEDRLGDGSRFGVGISYLRERQPLGTAGALGLLDGWDGPLLVINGDVLSRVRYGLLIDYHRDAHATVTMGVRKHGTQIPFGVVELDGHSVTAIVEKPTYEHYVNAGVYLLEPEVKEHVEPNRRMDMPELIQRIIDAGRPVSAFPILEDWIDIGRPEDYERAKESYA
jgi:dTDP-glucose pyrophosphorylase/CBS domain-containing protein